MSTIKTVSPLFGAGELSENFAENPMKEERVSFSCNAAEADKKDFAGIGGKIGRRRACGRKKEKTVVPVFFAADDNYLPFLAVALCSIKENASKNNVYKIYILHSGLKGNDAEKIMELQSEGFAISFVDVSERLTAVSGSLQLRDYYTCATYYRVFIAGMFPQYDKALYLDSDTIVLGDIGELFSCELGDNLIGAALDQAVRAVPPFGEYTNKNLGIDTEHYFNAGVILMNLKKFREEDFYDKFYELLHKYKFEVAQDQDYLNVLCHGRVTYISPAWNAMPIGKDVLDARPKLIHYNLTQKPWHYSNVKYQEFFWEYAEKTEFYHRIRKVREDFTPEMAAGDSEGEKNLIAMALREANSENNYFKTYVEKK